MTLLSLVHYAPLVPLFGFAFLSRLRVRSYLHIFQQDEYDWLRFLRWLFRSQSFDRTASSITLLAALVIFLTSSIVVNLIDVCVLLAAFLFVSFREAQQLKMVKKPLVMTNRARRISEIAWLISMLLSIGLAAGSAQAPRAWPLAYLLAVQLVPFSVLAANILLIPIERTIKERYEREARAKVRRVKPFVIGITGSFGKTSTKHILGHILQFRGLTLITPGSVNTLMGISRVIREDLRVSHRFFVVEMGAYGPGAIARLCGLVPPDLGIITAIGAAHLERFRSIDVTASAKFELADAILRTGGKVVVNYGLLAFEAVGARFMAHRQAFITCGARGADIELGEVNQTSNGLKFNLKFEQVDYEVEMPLFGEHHAENAAMAFAAATAIGIGPKEVQQALRTVPQIAHRLEVRHVANGATVIDDTYNSNPIGFESGLRLARVLKRGHGGRAYLLTPGMAELGSEHDAQHEKLGRIAAQCVDAVHLIRPERIPSFEAGWLSGGGSQQSLHTFESFKDAYAALDPHVSPSDVILMENDLPDIYERNLSF